MALLCPRNNSRSQRRFAPSVLRTECIAPSALPRPKDAHFSAGCFQHPDRTECIAPSALSRPKDAPAKPRSEALQRLANEALQRLANEAVRALLARLHITLDLPIIVLSIGLPSMRAASFLTVILFCNQPLAPFSQRSSETSSAATYWTFFVSLFSIVKSR